MSIDNSDEEQPLSATELSRTADVFTTRIQRRKKEHAEQKDAEQQESQDRHRRMLQILANIRRSLVDVARINLGERFSFKLKVDDWEGWPRLTICLEDTQDANAELPVLQVTASDRQSKGIVQIYVGTSERAVRVSLLDPSSLTKLPSLLRQCAREYLDDIAELILAIEHAPEDHLSALDEKIGRQEEAATGFTPAERNLSSDLYSDEHNYHDPFEKLAPVDEVKSLIKADDASFDKE